MDKTMTTRLTVPVALLTLSLSGCAFQETLESGSDNPCATLKAIVADFPAEFSAFRKGGSNFRSITIYQAKEELIRGHCEVWAWGTGDSSYVCTVGAPNAEVATTRYTNAVEQVTSCIGSEWVPEEAARESNGKPAGMVTRFRHQDDGMPVISVHNVEDRWRPSIYLYIGSPARAL